MSEYNLIVLEDYSASCDVEGGTIICGSLNSNTNVKFGCGNNGVATNSKAYTLEVNKDCAVGSGGSIKVARGRACFGKRSGRTVSKKNNNWCVDDTTIDLVDTSNDDPLTIDSSLDAKCDNISGAVIDLCKKLSDLSMNNNKMIEETNKITFNVGEVDCNGVAVFNIDSPFDRCKKNTIFYLVKNSIAVKFIVININNNKIIQTEGAQWDESSWDAILPNGCASIIWNMPKATSIQLKGEICGSILAPYATATGSSSNNVNINGVLVANSISWKGYIFERCIVPPICNNICNSSTTT